MNEITKEEICFDAILLLPKNIGKLLGLRRASRWEEQLAGIDNYAETSSGEIIEIEEEK